MIPVSMSWAGKLQLILFWNPAASFWGWEFVPNKNTSFMNLTPFTQEKNAWNTHHFDSFLSYFLWAPKKLGGGNSFFYFHPEILKWVETTN